METLNGARVRYAGRTIYTITDETADATRSTFIGGRGVVLATGPRGDVQPLFLQFDDAGQITHAATQSRPWGTAQLDRQGASQQKGGGAHE